MTDKQSIYDVITAKIIAAVEANPGAPKMPWHRAAGSPLHMPSNASTRNAYRGINILSLWIAAEVASFATPVWATYRQWAALGCQVRQGEKAAPVVFYKEFDVEPEAERPDDDGKRRMARGSHVFNCAQVDGYTVPGAPADLGPIARTAAFDAFVAATAARIEHGGDRAFYRPSTDTITMPDEGRFCGTETMSRDEGYMSTLAHELAHWSGTSSRLDRDMGKRFGDAQYAAEELVAEITAALICCDLGITPEPRPDHAQYIAQYLSLLKNDNRAIFTAAAAASRAAAYLQGFSAREIQHPIEAQAA